MEKDLTLLIPSYNKAPYIERMVKSLSEQTYIDRTKIIVCDDKSTDNSVEILKQCANKYRVPMILFINDKNLGVSGNNRKLYKMIDTEFFAMMDVDDYYLVPYRLERAVEFLRTHPDYSMHGCNFYWETPDGNRRAAFPSNVANSSFDKYTTMPFFQTSAHTFRNFFDSRLLNAMDKLAGNKKVHFTSADAFRNFCAVHYGKIYLDNFFGSVYAMQVDSAWASLSNFEKILSQLNFDRELAKFSTEFFNDGESANFLLNEYAKNYFATIDLLRLMMNDLSAKKFRLKPSMIEKLNLQSDDILAVVKYLLDQADFLKSIGAGRKLST